MDNTILQNSQALLATVLSFGGAYGTYAVKKIFDYFTTKTSIIKDTEARDVANNALSTLDTLLETNITYAENVLKKPIIDAIADGKVTKDELKSLADIVKTNVISQLSDDSKTALSKIAINVEDFVEKRLETVLGNLKVSDTSSVKVTEVSLPTQEEIDTASLKNQLAQAQVDKDNLTQTNTNLQASIDSLNKTNSDLTDQLNQSQAKNESLNQQIQELTNKFNTINSALSQVVSPVVATATDATQTTVQA